MQEKFPEQEKSSNSCLGIILAIILVSIFFVLTFANIGWGMPDRRSSATDNLVLDGYWAHLGKDLSRANIDLYPPVCYLQMDFVFRLLRLAIHQWDVKLSVPELASYYIIAGRCISALLTLGTGFIVFTIGRRLFTTRIGLWASTLFLLNPVTSYYGNTTNTEATYIFYFTLACYFFLRFYQAPKCRKYSYLFFASSAIAVASKDQAGFLLIGLAGWMLIKHPKLTMRSGIFGLTVFTFIYIYWGGIFHLFTHLAIMRENSKLFEIYSNQPGQIVKLIAEFIYDFIKTAGLGIIAAGVCYSVFRRQAGVDRLRNITLLVLVPYFLAIVFLAHRSYPRYVFPFLPLIAIAAGVALHRLEVIVGHSFRWGVVAILLIWTIGFMIHLRENPRDLSKELIRAAIRAGSIPKETTLCIFTKTAGTQYKLGKNNTWVPVKRIRDWFWERYGWVSPEIRIVTLLPEQQQEVQHIKPGLIVVFDTDNIKVPIQGYRQLYRFEGKFPQLYDYVYQPEGLDLYAANYISMTVLKDGSFY